MSLIHVHIGVYNMQKKACFDGIFRCPYNSFCSALCKFTTHTVWQITEHSATVVLILSGALASSNTNLEQTRGYRSSPLGALRPNVPPSGRHPCTLVVPLLALVANRPLSPHLLMKKPQLSATFSISHRIFGVALGVAIISVPLATKFSIVFGVWE
jgi:succinate dehydrogenase (ubiquinone) cytochrome b560 subunit